MRKRKGNRVANIFLMSGAYAYVALHPNRPELVVFLTILTGGICYIKW